MTDDNDNRPATPSEEDCCGSGCNPCILDVHKKLLDEWYKRKANNVKIKITKNLLSPSTFKLFIIDNKEISSEDCILIRLTYKGQICDESLLLNPGQYIILYSWGMSRPYTPISWTNKEIYLLVKTYYNGQFSTHLENATIGEEINIRGPYGDFQYQSNSFQQIFMFCIGSGIAALYPIAKMIIDNEQDETRIHLVAGFRTISHVPLKKELRRLTDFWNFTCTLHISQQSDCSDFHGVCIKDGRLDKESIVQLLECNNRSSTLVVICGTPHFNRFLEECVKEMSYSHIYVFQ